MSDGLIITAQVVGAEQVQIQLAQTSLAMQKRIRMTVNALGATLQRNVKSNYLSSGARVGKIGPTRGGSLGVQSGRLRRSINVSNTEDGASYSSSVGTNVPYGAYWEKGFDRKIGAGARGGPRRNLTELAAVKYWAKHPPGMKHEEARPFLQPALQDMKDEIRARLASAVGGN
jgi:phage gpG-like protein